MWSRDRGLVPDGRARQNVSALVQVGPLSAKQILGRDSDAWCIWRARLQPGKHRGLPCLGVFCRQILILEGEDPLYIAQYHQDHSGIAQGWACLLKVVSNYKWGRVRWLAQTEPNIFIWQWPLTSISRKTLRVARYSMYWNIVFDSFYFSWYHKCENICSSHMSQPSI